MPFGSLIPRVGSSGGGLNVGIKASTFFRGSAVMKPAKTGTERYLSKAGHRTRQKARGFIKKKGAARKAPEKYDDKGQIRKVWFRWHKERMDQPASPPGSPPFTHSSESVNLRDAIRYGFGPARMSVLVGPFAHHAKTADIWQLHEFGGTRTTLAGKTRRYPARPFMGRALEKVTPQLPKLWQDSVR